MSTPTKKLHGSGVVCCVSLICQVFLLFACAVPPTPIAPTATENAPTTPSPIPTTIATTPITAAPTLLKAITATATMPPTASATDQPALSLYASLTTGTYIVFAGADGFTDKGVEADSLFAADIDGTGRTQRLTNHVTGLPVGPAVTTIAYTDPNWKILDLPSNKVREVKLSAECLISSGFAALEKLAATCNNDGEIYIADLQDGTTTRLTTWSTSKPSDTWYAPEWSPDGKWIAYFNLPDQPSGPEDGIYLTDTSCLADPQTCRPKTIGPINGPFEMFYPPTWSPDSRQLAILPRGSPVVYLLDVETKRVRRLPISNAKSGLLESLAWSPDGKQLAYMTPDVSNIVYAIPISGGVPTELVNDVRLVDLVGWLQVP